MTRTTNAAPTTVATPAAETALRDMAYVLKLTGKISADIRSGKGADPRKPRANQLAAV